MGMMVFDVLVSKTLLSPLSFDKIPRGVLFLSGCLGLLLLIGPSDQTHAQEIQAIAAIVNDEVISTYDVQQRTKLVLSSSGVDPTPDIVQRIHAQVLRTLVDEKLQMQEAARYEVEVTEEEVEESIERLGRQNNLSVGDIEETLNQGGIGVSTLRTQVLAEIAWSKLVNGLLSPRVSVPRDEIELILEQLALSSDKPQYLVSEVFLGVESREQEQQIYQGGLQLIQQMQQGVPFQVVAQQFSSAPSSAQGGDIGWVQDGELQSELNEALRRMQPGQISSPIRTRGGYIILALRDRRVVGGGPDPMSAIIDLAQIMVPLPEGADAKAIKKLEKDAASIQKALEGCSNLDSATQSVDGATSSRLGRLQITEMSSQFQPIVATLQTGEASAPIRTETGFHVLVACDRQNIGEARIIPSRLQIEDRLYDQQLSMLARRYLRDIRRDSTIEMLNKIRGFRLKKIPLKEIKNLLTWEGGS